MRGQARGRSPPTAPLGSAFPDGPGAPPSVFLRRWLLRPAPAPSSPHAARSKISGCRTNASPSARVLSELVNERAGPGPGCLSTTLNVARGSNARQAAVLGHCVRHRYRHQPAPRRAFAPARSSIVVRLFAGELRAPRHCVERPEASVSRHDEGYGREPLPVDGRPDGPAREEGRGLEAGGDVLFQARSVRASSLILLRLVARVQPPPRALDGARWPDDLSPRLTPRPGVCRPAQQDRHDAHHGGESCSVFCAVGLSSAPCCSAPRSLLPAFTLSPTCACSIISHAAPLRPSSTTTSSGWGA